MKLRWLLVSEGEKLLRAPVFWVGPVVILIYLVLMLVGYETYAAKNSNYSETKQYSDEELKEYTGSFVVSGYASLQTIASNLFGFLFSRYSDDGEGIVGDGKKYEFYVDSSKIDALKDFDYLNNLFKNLLNPSMPKPEGKECDCNCGQESMNREDISSLPPRLMLLTELFVGNTLATKPDLLKKPEEGEHSLFVERLQQRISWLMEPKELSGKLIHRKRFNGLRYVYLSLYFGMLFIMPIITLSLVSQVIAGEYQYHTMGSNVIRAGNRTRLFLAKILAIFGYLTALLFLFVVISLIVGISTAGYGNLYVDSQLLGYGGDAVMVLGDGALILFFCSVPLMALSLLPLASFGILLAQYKPDTATVIGVSSGVYFIMVMLGQLPIFTSVRWLFFTSYMDNWLHLFESPFPVSAFVGKLVVCIWLALVMLFCTDYLLRKKDIFT